MTNFKALNYLLMSVDPVHIGTGGYRLGSVDNSIVREPGTGVPKIPGSSIHGAARAYAARIYGDLEAAGKDHHSAMHGPANPVLYTFGTAAESETQGDERSSQNKAFSGVVNVFDAHLVLFPVASLAGPVWVSTDRRLHDAGFTLEPAGNDENIESCRCKSTLAHSGPINLGWLVLDAAGRISVKGPESCAGDSRLSAITERIVLVDEKLFGHIVNSNLEVRTSVSIDPYRGAAEQGALFTYEAIPRAAVFSMDVVVDNYRTDRFPGVETLASWLDEKVPDAMKAKMKENGWTDTIARQAQQHGNARGVDWNSPLDVFTAGLRHLQWLGVGGMGTRGFGRIAILGNRETEI